MQLTSEDDKAYSDNSDDYDLANWAPTSAGIGPESPNNHDHLPFVSNVSIPAHDKNDLGPRRTVCTYCESEFVSNN